MNNQIKYLVILIVGVGIGTGIGILISKPEINKSQKELDQLMTQMQTSKDESEKTIQRAAAEIARKENELKRTKTLLIQMDTQLKEATAQLQQIKTGNISPNETQPVAMSTPTGSTSTTAAHEYTIQEGDSLWKIAQNQLGDGLRYKEILKFNPEISENQTLTVGMKIKLPEK